MEEIMLTSANAYKAQEFEGMFGPPGYTVKALLDLKEDIEIKEAGAIFEENALIRTKAIHERLGIEVIADDGSFTVSALDDAPGIYSARFMSRDTSYDVENQYLIDQCRYVEDRGCQLVCAIAYVWTGGSEHVFTGVVEGIVTDHMEGTKGLGYNPISYYPPYGITLANMNREQESRVSHRGRALAKLVAFMEKEE